MNQFDPSMNKAWFVLLITGAMLIVLAPIKLPYSVGFLLICLGWFSVYSALVIFLLRKLATEDGLLKSKKTITVWGYIWRTTIVHYISLGPAVLVTLASIGSQPHVTILSFIVINVLHLLFSAGAVWCIFSRDRKSQIQWLFSLGRGY